MNDLNPENNTSDCVVLAKTYGRFRPVNLQDKEAGQDQKSLSRNPVNPEHVGLSCVDHCDPDCLNIHRKRLPFVLNTLCNYQQ